MRFVLALLTLLLLGLVSYALIAVKLDSNAEKLTYTLLTGLRNLSTSTVGWFTSSPTSAGVNKTIESQSKLLAASNRRNRQVVGQFETCGLKV